MDLSVLPELVPRLLAIGVLIMCSVFFSGSETALFSLSRVARERMARSSHATERYAVKLTRDPRRLIVTILVGNEVVNMTFSSLSAGVMARVLPGMEPAVLTAVTTAVMVPFLLIFGEITPKSIALR